MVSVMVIGSVEDGVVGRQHGGLISLVQIHSISIEESGKDEKQQVHVDGSG